MLSGDLDVFRPHRCCKLARLVQILIRMLRQCRVLHAVLGQHRCLDAGMPLLYNAELSTNRPVRSTERVVMSASVQMGLSRSSATVLLS